MPKLYRMLKPGGKLLVLYMAWLPYEDKIAQKSEEIVLKYSPEWSGAGASLSKEELKEWESEHLKMLSEAAPEEFDIKHYMALVELQTRKKDYVE